MRVLIAGWFSFDGMGATAGDLLCRDLVGEWLQQADCPFDVANARPFTGGVDWNQVDASRYTHLIFVCGPFGNGWPVTEMLERFAHCRWIGLNLTMLDRLENWNPFELLLERDSDQRARPDLTFFTSSQRVPVVGVILAHHQKEYRSRGRHVAVDAAVERLIASREAAFVRIDTRLDEGVNPLRTPAEVESLIARMDCVVTTRLHGTVLALKNGVPALAIDPIAGGAKVARQAETIGWPVCFIADSFTDAELQAAFDYVLTSDARDRAALCREHARRELADLKTTVLRTLRSPTPAKV